MNGVLQHGNIFASLPINYRLKNGLKLLGNNSEWPMVDKWVKDMVEDAIGKSQMQIGKISKHPVHGRVKITDGQLWGTHGFSNFWYWRKVDKNNRPYGKTYNGYGWK